MPKGLVESAASGVWWKRALWLLLIWSGSVAVLGVVAYALRWLMRMVGMAA